MEMGPRGVAGHGAGDHRPVLSRLLAVQRPDYWPGFLGATLGWGLKRFLQPGYTRHSVFTGPTTCGVSTYIIPSYSFFAAFLQGLESRRVLFGQLSPL